MKLTSINVSNTIAIPFLRKFLGSHLGKYQSVTLLDYFPQYKNYQEGFKICEGLPDLQKISFEKMYELHQVKDLLDQSTDVIYFFHNYSSEATNNEEELQHLLPLLEAQTHLKNIFLVDNSFTVQSDDYQPNMDSLVSKVKERIPSVKVVKIEEKGRESGSILEGEQKEYSIKVQPEWDRAQESKLKKYLSWE